MKCIHYSVGTTIFYLSILCSLIRDDVVYVIISPALHTTCIINLYKCNTKYNLPYPPRKASCKNFVGRTLAPSHTSPWNSWFGSTLCHNKATLAINPTHTIALPSPLVYKQPHTMHECKPQCSKTLTFYKPNIPIITETENP